MKVLSSTENKNLYTEQDVRHFVGLYHLGAINPIDDPVLTAIVLEALHKQNEQVNKKRDNSHSSLKMILKYSILFVFVSFCIGTAIALIYIASK